MAQIVEAPTRSGIIENPVINSPYVEPTRYFEMSASGEATGETKDGRRPSEFFVPVAQPRKKSAQMALTYAGSGGAPARQQSNEIVNEIRQSVKIPYTFEGRPGNYVPDFLIRLRDPDSTGPDDLLTLVLEVTGEARPAKKVKVAAAEHLWTEAVNNWGGLGRWAFLEVTDPWDAGNLIRGKFLAPVRALV